MKCRRGFLGGDSASQSQPQWRAKPCGLRKALTPDSSPRRQERGKTVPPSVSPPPPEARVGTRLDTLHRRT